MRAHTQHGNDNHFEGRTVKHAAASYTKLNGFLHGFFFFSRASILGGGGNNCNRNNNPIKTIQSRKMKGKQKIKRGNVEKTMSAANAADWRRRRRARLLWISIGRAHTHRGMMEASREWGDSLSVFFFFLFSPIPARLSLYIYILTTPVPFVFIYVLFCRLLLIYFLGSYCTALTSQVGATSKLNSRWQGGCDCDYPEVNYFIS